MYVRSKWVTLARDVLLSIALSWLTGHLIAGIDRLPYSPTRDAISDVLRLPGGFVAGLFYPEGIHTGRGSIGWAYIAVAGNVVFYAILWFFLIRIITRIRHGRRLRRSVA